jgi:hypothetical protein
MAKHTIVSFISCGFFIKHVCYTSKPHNIITKQMCLLCLFVKKVLKHVKKFGNVNAEKKNM